ncbi:MAG TPA: OmpA family protein [Vicinamibacterales bacterium]|jgi:outer membrane protein OmpA-like peptidoglycan-associated protein|nr:OmpA family protein [Vicinamibacterales bacterium]
MVRKFVMAAAIMALAVGGTTACASKKFVRSSVGEVNTKVDSLGRSVEETQERTRRNEGRISEVDAKAQAAADSATKANQAAAAAQSAAGEAGEGVRRADAKFSAIDATNRRLVYEVVLSEDQGNFRFNQVALPDEAKSAIDQMVNQLKADPKNIFIEIEGHTDNVGDPLVNERIGLERAEAVQRYLYEQYQIPLHKMNVISYGEEKPVSPNNTRDGRAQNRRVVIKVLT